MNIGSVKLQYEKNLLSISGVTGIGLDRINQKIIVYIEDEKTFDFGKIPLFLGEFEIEFRIAPQPHYLQSPCTNTDRPLIGGVCFGTEWYDDPYYNLACGTLGAIIRDKNTHEEFLLTNRHVIEDNYGEINFDVINPCDWDGPIVGRTSIVSSHYDELVDVALINPYVSTQRTIKSIGEVQGASHPQVGISVKKYGMKTGLTYGNILDIDYSTNVEGIFYRDQILTTDMVISGDSGSVLLNNNNEAVGLLFAGGSGIAIANKISNVILIFNIYFNNPDELLPECECSEWVDEGCISNTQRWYTRNCNPQFCDEEAKIVDDPSCYVTPPTTPGIAPLLLLGGALLLIPALGKK